MKRKLISISLATVLLATPFSNVYSIMEVETTQDIDDNSEYVSELNPIKPSVISADYIVKFKNNASKEFIIKSLKIKNKTVYDDITVKDIRAKKAFIGDLNELNQKELSLEGMQFCRDLLNVSLSNGEYDEKKMEEFFSPVSSLKNINVFSLKNFDLKEVPKVKAFKNVSVIKFSNNKIKNLDGLEFYEKVKNIEMNSNEITNIEGLKVYKDQLKTVSLANNKIGDDTFRSAFSEKYTKFTGFDPAIFSYNRITDTTPITNINNLSFMSSFFGKQNITKVVETEEFELPIKSHHVLEVDENGNFVEFKKGSIEEPINLSLDKNSDIEQVETGKYKIVDKNKTRIIAYWNKQYFDDTNNIEKPRENASIWSSGIANIVNLLPLKESINMAKDNPNDENIKKANDKFNEAIEINKELDSEELNTRLEEYKEDIEVLNNLEQEYVSSYNPVYPSLAKNEQVISVPDKTLRKIILVTLDKPMDSSITVGDMRKLTKIMNFSLIGKSLKNNSENEDLLIKNLEGLQYATNLEQLTNSYSSTNTGDALWVNEKERLDIFMNPDKIPPREYTGYFAPIKGLKKITNIGMAMVKVTSKDLIDIMNKDLEHLTITNSLIDDVSLLSNFKNLKYLDLSNNIISDGTGLESLDKLEKFNLSYSGVKINDTSFLAGMKNLKELRIAYNFPWEMTFDNEFDIKYIKELKSLEKLYIYSNGIKNIEVLESLPNLEYLDITNNRIIDMSPLKNLKDNSTIIEAFSQVPVVVLENGNYEFSIDLMGIDGNKVEFLRSPLDYDIKKISDGKYELKNKDEVRLIRSWNNDPRSGIRFSGDVVVFNKNKVEELVKIAKEDPIQKNINKAKSALELLGTLPTQTSYVNEQVAALEDLKPGVSAESVSLNKSKLTLTTGEKEKLTATVSPENAKNKEIEWSSSNANIAKVDAQGNVEAIAEGKATITAKVKGTDIKATAQVNVTKKPEVINAESINLNASSANLNKDETYKLVANINPKNSTQKDIVWTSTNDSVVTVTNNGLVKAIGKGKATINARIKNTEISAKVNFTVNDNTTKPESIGLSSNIIKLNLDQKDRLIATIKPDNANNKEIEWSSSNTNVVRVDDIGNMVAVGYGNAKIIAKIKDTDINAEAEVIVSKPIDNNFIDINEHWGKDFINKAIDLGLFKGVTNELFAPDSNMTRGMFVTVLGRLSNESIQPNKIFNDVNPEAYYAQYIAWAEEKGIIKGYGNGNFGPDDNISREEMATIIKRYADYRNIELEKSNDKVNFNDFNEISEWAKESVVDVQKAGLIEGKKGNIFDSKANSTRAEVATILVRFIEKYFD